MDPKSRPREKSAVLRTDEAAALPGRSTSSEGLVRVREYVCTACIGDPPQAEQFGRSSIAIVQTGVFGIRTGKRTEVLSTGFLLLGNSGQNYEASHEHGAGDRCLVFDFPSGAIEELAASLRKRERDSAQPFAVNVLAPHPEVDALRKLAEEMIAEGSSAATVEELGLALGAHVLARAGTGTARSPGQLPDSRKARDHIVAAMAHIEACAFDELRLSDLAGATGLSPFHFLRLFKRETGVTPHRFLLWTRIRRAIDLLRDTRRPITAIAFEVGFGDHSNFVNAFRREVGCSPRQYRQIGRAPKGMVPAAIAQTDIVRKR
jgi:AraC family transcriptional regulator